MTLPHGPQNDLWATLGAIDQNLNTSQMDPFLPSFCVAVD